MLSAEEEYSYILLIYCYNVTSRSLVPDVNRNGNICKFLFRFDELVKKFKVEYHAGGATQNSIKIAQVRRISYNPTENISVSLFI